MGGIGVTAWDAAASSLSPPNVHPGDSGGFPEDSKAEITAEVNQRVLGDIGGGMADGGGIGGGGIGGRRQDLRLLWLCWLLLLTSKFAADGGGDAADGCAFAVAGSATAIALL